jgi:small subunit ribosomal protein S20
MRVSELAAEEDTLASTPRRNLKGATRRCAPNILRQLDIRPGVGHISRSDCSQKNTGDQLVPNIASAKKNMRKSRAAAIRNRAQRSALRTALKRASSGGNAEDSLAAVKLLDRASRKGLIHKNAAARHKSRLARAAK